MALEYSIDELNEIVERYNNEVLRLGQATRATTEAFNDANRGVRGYTASLNYANEHLKSSAKTLGLTLLKGEEGIGQFADTLTAVSNVLDKITVGGSLLVQGLKKFSNVIINTSAAGLKNIDVLSSTYQELTRFGTGVTSFEDTFQTLQKFNYSVDQAGAAKLSSLLRENAESLVMWGGSVTEGTKNFANLSNQIRSSGLYQSFQNLGMSSEEVNKAMAGYVRLTLQSGGQISKNQNEVNASLAKYVQETDAITKLTGITREQQEKAVDRAMSEERFRARIEEARANRDDKEVERLQQLAKVAEGLPAEMRQGLLDSVTDPTTDAAIKFRMTFGAATENVDAFVKGSMPLAETLQSLAVAGKEAVTNFAPLAKFGATSDFMFFVGAADLNLKFKDAVSAQAEVNKLQQKQLEQQGTVTDNYNKILNTQNELRKLYESATTSLASVVTELGTFAPYATKLLSDTRNLIKEKLGGGFVTEGGPIGGGPKVKPGSAISKSPEERAAGSLGTVGKLFENWGKGTMVELHGIEGVMKPEDLVSIVKNTLSAVGSSMNQQVDPTAESTIKSLMSAGVNTVGSIAAPRYDAGLGKFGASKPFLDNVMNEIAQTVSGAKTNDAGSTFSQPIQIQSPVIVDLLSKQVDRLDQFIDQLSKLNASNERIAQLA